MISWVRIMLKLFLVLIFILFVTQSAGMFFCKRFSLKDTFNLPIGFGFYLFVLQLVYYPIQFYQLNSIFIMIGSLVVSGVFGVYGLIHLKEMICSLKKLDYLWIVISTALFKSFGFNIKYSTFLVFLLFTRIWPYGYWL